MISKELALILKIAYPNIKFYTAELQDWVYFVNFDRSWMFLCLELGACSVESLHDSERIIVVTTHRTSDTYAITLPNGMRELHYDELKAQFPQ